MINSGIFVQHKRGNSDDTPTAAASATPATMLRQGHRSEVAAIPCPAPRTLQRAEKLQNKLEIRGPGDIMNIEGKQKRG